MIIAHRGASKEEPENTLVSIKRAIEIGAQFVEIDVRLSKDDIPVVLHDPSPARMIGVKESTPIRQLTLSEIKAINIAGQKIPTLEEILNLAWKNTGLMIEIKQGIRDVKMLVNAVLHEIEKVKNPPPIIIGSFSLEIMEAVKNHPSRHQLGIDMIGIIEKQKMISPFLHLGMKHLALWHRLIKPENIAEILKNNIKIWSFTVDNPEMAKFLISLGINGIISNNPRLMLKYRAFSLH